MTVIDEPTELAPRPRADQERPKRLLGPAFWAMIAFGLVCIAVGAVIGVYGAKLFPAAGVVQPLAAPAAPAAAAAPIETVPADQPPPAPPVSSGEVAALADRVSQVETAHRSTLEAAAAALAVSAAAEAADTSGPFVRELDAVARLLPESVDMAALRDMATTGAPTRTALITAFPAAADRAAARARAPAEGEGVAARLTHALAALVSVRRVDRVTGKGADPILARAERKVTDGDLSGALTELSELPPAAREAMAEWRSGAERRAAIDRRISAVRATALRGLVQAGRLDKTGPQETAR